MQTLWRGPVIVPWQGVLERLKSFVGRFNQRGVLTKNIIKNLSKSLQQRGWMVYTKHSLIWDAGHLTTVYVTSALESVGYQEVSDDDDPPFFPNQLFFFFHFWSTCPVYSSHKMCFCLRNLYLILTRMKKTGVLGKWELSKWDFRA